MDIELIPSLERIVAGDRVTYEIRGLKSRPEGTYIVRWIIDPTDRLAPAGDDVRPAGGGLYSVVSADEPADSAKAAFNVREPGHR